MNTVAAKPSLVTGGVDTYLDTHVAAALDHLGGLLGTAQFPTTAGGYRQLLAWLRGFGEVGRVGVEGTGSYGADLGRDLSGQGVKVIEVSDPTGRSAADTARPMSSTRSPLPGRSCPARPPPHPRPTTGPS